MSGRRKETTQVFIDGILRFLAMGGFLTTALVLPNSVQLFDKPLDKLFDTLDDRSRKREMRRVMHYMKQRGLIAYHSSDYENGIILTKAGKQRLEQRSFETLTIAKPLKWDRYWRLVFFDIPERQKSKRNSLTLKLRMLGCQQLQKSIWIHPFPCRAEIEAITEVFGIRRFVTYVEISEIDGDRQLRNRFKTTLGTSA